jgi:hypothetical protein
MKIFALTTVLLVGSSSYSQRNPRDIEMNWKTDQSKSNLDLQEIFVCIGKDDIPAIDDPNYYTIAEAEREYFEFEPLIFIEHDLKAKGYPLSVLLYHEIVNDSIIGLDSTLYYTVTYCPLCNSAIVFNRKTRINGEQRILDFGVSGMLRNSDMIMYDRQTESWWQQFTGQGLVGELSGQKLDFLTAPVISMEEFSLFFPDGQVLSKNTGFKDEGGNDYDYGSNPYVGYDTDDTPFLYDGKVDDRLPPMERVVDITINGKHKIYPNSDLARNVVINDEFEGKNIALFYTNKIVSVLDSGNIEQSRTIGGVAAYFAFNDGKNLTFIDKGDGLFMDQQTKSIWNVKGQCIDGKLEGSYMNMITHGNHFAFAMLAFYPDCIVYGNE